MNKRFVPLILGLGFMLSFSAVGGTRLSEQTDRAGTGGVAIGIDAGIVTQEIRQAEWTGAGLPPQIYGLLELFRRAKAAGFPISKRVISPSGHGAVAYSLEVIEFAAIRDHRITLVGGGDLLNSVVMKVESRATSELPVSVQLDRAWGANVARMRITGELASAFAESLRKLKPPAVVSTAYQTPQSSTLSLHPEFSPYDMNQYDGGVGCYVSKDNTKTQSCFVFINPRDK